MLLSVLRGTADLAMASVIAVTVLVALPTLTFGGGALTAFCAGMAPVQPGRVGALTAVRRIRHKT